MFTLVLRDLVLKERKDYRALYFQTVIYKTLSNFVTGMSALMDQHYILIPLRFIWHQRDSKL